MKKLVLMLLLCFLVGTVWAIDIFGTKKIQTMQQGINNKVDKIDQDINTKLDNIMNLNAKIMAGIDKSNQAGRDINQNRNNEIGIYYAIITAESIIIILLTIVLVIIVLKQMRYEHEEDELKTRGRK